MINYEKEHRRLWNWLADHPEAEKEDYFKYWDYDNIPQDKCFACEVARRETDDIGYCRFCPLGGSQVVGCIGGLYIDWWFEEQPEKRRKLARQIANLTWKEKKEDDNETDQCR